MKKIDFKKIFQINDSPQRIALGLGLGVFLGILPGSGPIAALVLATFLRLNVLSAVLGSLLVNTWFSIITFFLALKIGSWFISSHWHLIFLPLAIGYFFISFGIGLLVYLFSLGILLYVRHLKLNKG